MLLKGGLSTFKHGLYYLANSPFPDRSRVLPLRVPNCFDPSLGKGGLKELGSNITTEDPAPELT